MNNTQILETLDSISTLAEPLSDPANRQISGKALRLRNEVVLRDTQRNQAIEDALAILKAPPVALIGAALLVSRWMQETATTGDERR